MRESKNVDARKLKAGNNCAYGQKEEEEKLESESERVSGEETG